METLDDTVCEEGAEFVIVTVMNFVAQGLQHCVLFPPSPGILRWLDESFQRLIVFHWLGNFGPLKAKNVKHNGQEQKFSHR
jgi:hypothetical protein